MNAASIRRLYPDLSGTERFRLAAQADARGDAAERDHLIATCPKVLVSIRDPEFGAAVTGAIELAEALLRSSAPFMAWLDLLGSMQRHVEGRSAHGSLPRNFPREFVQAARDRAARVLRALQDAFPQWSHGLAAVETP